MDSRNETNSCTKAIVLAGGLGTRLRPLTCTRPKPLTEVLGESLLGRLFRLMPSFGIKEAAVSTMYMPEKIVERFGEGAYGIKLSYINEAVPLGNAGGAKMCAASLCGEKTEADEDLLILSGDGIFDFDLSEAIRFHKERRADVTIVTTESETPLEYGVVLCTKDGRITGFSEKPAWEKVRSDTVNTGIYIVKKRVFDCVPEGREFDFSKDLFPLLMGEGYALFAYAAKGYWCDVGDTAAYYACTRDALCGKIGCIDKSGAYSASELSGMGIEYELPVWVSRRAKAEKGARIGAFSVLSDGVFVGSGAHIDGAILLENVHVGENAKIGSAIVCENTVIDEGAVIGSGTVIGADCRIFEKAEIGKGVSVWAGKHIGRGFTVAEDVIFENKARGLYSDDGFFAGRLGESVNCELLTRLGRSIGLALREEFPEDREEAAGRVGVMHDGSAESALVASSLLCGLKSCGVRTLLGGKGFEAQAKYAASSLLTDLFLFVTSQGTERTVKCFDRLSLSVSHDFERRIEKHYKSGAEKTYSGNIPETETEEGIRYGYFSELIASTEKEFGTLSGTSFRELLRGIKCRFEGKAEPFSAKHTLIRSIKELGGTVTEEEKAGVFHLSIDEAGLSPEIWEEGKNGERLFFDGYHVTAALLSYGIKAGAKQFALPGFIPSVYSEIFEGIGTGGGDPGHSRFGRRYISENRWIYDGCFALLRLLCILKYENKTLGELADGLPVFEVRVREIGTEEGSGDDRAAVMRCLSERYGSAFPDSDGVSVSYSGGRVTVIPRRSGGFRLISEAQSTEAAEEMCVDMAEEIGRIGKHRKKP